MSDLKDLRERENEKLHTSNTGKGQNNNKYPTHLRVLAILGAILFVAGIVMVACGTNRYEAPTEAQMYISMVGVFMLTFSFPLFVFALIPLIAKLRIKTTKYIAKDNKDDLKDIANSSGDIIGDTVKKLARNTAEGWQEVNDTSDKAASTESASADTGSVQKALYCEKCGQPISPTANYCKFCRAKINK